MEPQLTSTLRRWEGDPVFRDGTPLVLYKHVAPGEGRGVTGRSTKVRGGKAGEHRETVPVVVSIPEGCVRLKVYKFEVGRRL
jgi:hypothetical protein